MEWIRWVLAAWVSLGTLIMISQTGKPKKATTPGAAAVAVGLNALVIWGIFLI